MATQTMFVWQHNANIVLQLLTFYNLVVCFQVLNLVSFEVKM